MVENELQYMNAGSWRRMAPPILRLEVTRLGVLIDALPPAAPAHDALVTARHAVREAVRHLTDDALDDAAAACELPLAKALLNVSLAVPLLETDAPGGEAVAVLRYVFDRLRYVHDRLPLLY